MDAEKLINELNPFEGKAKMIKRRQSVGNIMKEILNAHAAFKGDYDEIAANFRGGSIRQICQRIYDFCRSEIPYWEESKYKQTTRSPAALLVMRDDWGGDCKHYSGFIGGILDALNRQGANIDWCYRFAGYNEKKELGHVFVVVNPGGNEIWVDPVLSEFDTREPNPTIFVDQKPTMALERISGFDGGFTSYKIIPKQDNAATLGIIIEPDRVLSVDGDMTYADEPSIEPQPRPTQVIVTLPDVPPPPPPPANIWVDPMPFLKTNAYNQFEMGVPFAVTVFKNQNLPPGAWQILPEKFPICYTVDGNPWPLPAGARYANDPTVQPLPPTLRVGFAPTFMGYTIPDDMPRPLVVDGKLRIWPLEFNGGNTNARLLEDNKVKLNLLMSAIGTLVKCYSPVPYADDLNKLSHYILDLRDKDDFLYPVDTKTLFGYLLEGANNALKAVVHGMAAFFGFGPRLCFLGLVRINAFAFAYKLFMAFNDDRKHSLEKQWYDMGGSVGDLKEAIELGCRNTPFWGGHTKHWIVDAVQDGIIDNGYIMDPNDTEGIPEGNTIPTDNPAGAAIGVVGADDVVYYLAAAGTVICALGKFLKGIGGPKTDKIVDDVINAYDVVLAAAGQDPISLANQTGRPVQYTDADGKTQTVYPTTQKESAITTFIKDNPVAAVAVAGLLGWGLYEIARTKRRRN